MSSSTVTKAAGPAVRTLVRGWAAAKRRGRAIAAPAKDPARMLDEALELWELNPTLLDSPADKLRVREVALVRAMWRRLRAACGGDR